MSDWKKSRCEYDDCKLGFAEPFADDTPRAAEFKRKAGERESRPMSEVSYCGCGGLVIDVFPDGDVSPDAGAEALPGGETYGALILACDLSGSMFIEKMEGRSSMKRHQAVVSAVSHLLRDFAGKIDLAFAANDRRFDPSLRDRQYSRLLLRVFRFGKNVTRFECPDGKGGQTPWFTVEMLARYQKWRLEEKGELAGAFELSAIEATVEKVLLPRGAADMDGTNLAAVLDAVTDAAQELDLGGKQKPRAAGLPADYDGLGTIPKAAGQHQAWAAIYTDGQANLPVGGCVPATEQAIARLVNAAPKLNRITAFFGSAKEDADPAAGGLLRRVASKCYVPHPTEQLSYLGPDRALKLRDVVHMATATDKGICLECLEGESRRRARP